MNIDELDKKLMVLYGTESMVGTEDVREYFSEISEDSNMAHFQELAPHYCLGAKHIILARYYSKLKDEITISTMMNKVVQDILKSDYRNIPFSKSLLCDETELVTQQISMFSYVSLIKVVKDITNGEDVIRQALNLDGLSISMGYYTYLTALINRNFSNSFNELFIKSWCNYFENIYARTMMFQMAKNDWKEQIKGIPF